MGFRLEQKSVTLIDNEPSNSLYLRNGIGITYYVSPSQTTLSI